MVDKKQIALIYNEMELLKQSGIITKCNFGQCPLEQIFINKIKH